MPSTTVLAGFADLTDADREALGELRTAIHARDPRGSSTTRLLGWPDSLQGEVVDSDDPVVLLQLDGGMKAPKGLAQVFSQWGHGLVHFLVTRSDLEKKKLSGARAMLAYT